MKSNSTTTIKLSNNSNINLKTKNYRNSSSGLTAALFGIINELNNEEKQTSESLKEGVKKPVKRLITEDLIPEKCVTISQEKEKDIEPEMEHPLDPSSTKPTREFHAMVCNKKKDLEREIESITRAKSIKEAVIATEVIMDKEIIAKEKTKNEYGLYSSTKKESNIANTSLKNFPIALYSNPTHQNQTLESVENSQNNFIEKRYIKDNSNNLGFVTNGTDKNDLTNQKFYFNKEVFEGKRVGMSSSNTGNENESENCRPQKENDAATNNSGSEGILEMRQIWFKNAQVINDDEIFGADIFIENGIIS